MTKKIYFSFVFSRWKSVEKTNFVGNFQRKSTKLKSHFFVIFEHVHYFFSVKIQIQRFFFSLKISNENQRSKLGSLEFDSNSNDPKN